VTGNCPTKNLDIKYTTETNNNVVNNSTLKSIIAHLFLFLKIKKIAVNIVLIYILYLIIQKYMIELGYLKAYCNKGLESYVIDIPKIVVMNFFMMYVKLTLESMRLLGKNTS
jgi:hypothetical protein